MTLIVATGTRGQVVSALRDLIANQPNVELVTIGRPKLDLTAEDHDIAANIVDLSPDIVVGTAAFTAVDDAEGKPKLAMRLNGVVPGEVARGARDLGVPIIHLSTDYVFSGQPGPPWTELDPTDPDTVYGYTKLVGERAVIEANPRHLIFRTARIFSPYGDNFLRTMLTLSKKQDEIEVVDDQYGNPTSAYDIANAILHATMALNQCPDDSELFGTFHVAGRKAASWADFADEIFQQSKQLGGPWAHVRRVGSDAFLLKARRPQNSVLSTEKFTRTFGYELAEYVDSIRTVLRKEEELTKRKESPP